MKIFPFNVKCRDGARTLISAGYTDWKTKSVFTLNTLKSVKRVFTFIKVQKGTLFRDFLTFFRDFWSKIGNSLLGLWFTGEFTGRYRKYAPPLTKTFWFILLLHYLQAAFCLRIAIRISGVGFGLSESESENNIRTIRIVFSEF